MTIAFPADGHEDEDDQLEPTPPDDLGQAWFDLLWPDEEDLSPEPSDFDLDERGFRALDDDPTAA